MTKRLKDLGEDGLLALLAPMLRRQTAGLVLPTGDDVCVTAGETNRLVWTIDAMVEGTHFRFWERAGRADWVGRKLAASNLSDLASKGATPLYGLLSFGAPGEAPAELIEAFFEGLGAELEEEGARLIGGDTVRAPQWSLSLALVGRLAEDATVASRDRARPGQNVYVTGSPGESGAGFHLLEEPCDGLDDETCLRLIDRHVRPKARVTEGRGLVSAFDDLAMLDISDGVARDALRIVQASEVAIELDEGALPVSNDLRAFAEQSGRHVTDLLLFGGEDYELLFTTGAGPEAVESALRKAGSEIRVTHVGRVGRGSGLRLREVTGNVSEIRPKGFEHYA